MTLPFWTSTLAGGCANLHSVSGLEHLFLWNSLQTSSCNHRESLPFIKLFMLTIAMTMGTLRCSTVSLGCASFSNTLTPRAEQVAVRNVKVKSIYCPFFGKISVGVPVDDDYRVHSSRGQRQNVVSPSGA